MTFFKKEQDGSIVSKDGTVIFCSLRRFRRDIVEGDCCFLCGASPNEKDFNDEHVIPDWLLRYLGLHDKEITLPNSNTIKYSQYKIPCCADCNRFLGREIEEPISNILKSGIRGVAEHLKVHGTQQFFEWMNLLFLKTHLKDQLLRISLDERKGNNRIGDIYDWEMIHHIYCMARARYIDAHVRPRVFGSFFCLPAKDLEFLDSFDYADIFRAKTVFIQFQDTALFCVLDDAGSTLSLMRDKQISKIEGPLSSLQLREILARISYVNILTQPRPRFFTKIENGSPHISAHIRHPFHMVDSDDRLIGELMHYLCGGIFEQFNTGEHGFTAEDLKDGCWSFIFDDEGKFVSDSLEPLHNLGL